MSTVAALLDELRTALGPDRVREGVSERDLHGEDLTFHAPARPDAVVLPSTTADVATVLAAATARGVPVVPYGAGTSLEGHVIPVHGGISLDLGNLDRVVALSPADLTATVQAGVTRLQLDRAASEHGLCFPVDPGADATLGGMAATNAAGTTTVRYGKMRPNVLALEAVTGDGRVIRTGTRAAKSSAGYDLTGLLVGSEGTLAVITELTLRLHPVLEHAAVLRAAFGEVEEACAAAAALVAAGAGVTRVELLDGWFVAAINAYSGTTYPEGPCLFVEATGTRETVAGDLELARALCAEHGAVELVAEQDPDARARLWRARHDATHAISARWPGTKERSTDVCVPLTELAAATRFARSEVERLALRAGIVGHAGDGNLHVAVMVDPDDAEELARSDELVHRVVDDALARGGTCTGEHGIGLGKVDALAQEHGDLLPLMRAVKRAFDPAWILNPGKVLAPPQDDPA